MKVVTKDSGKREHYFTGAQRDTHEDKPRFDLIPLALLNSLQMAEGGAPLRIDQHGPPIVDFLPEASDEYRPDLIPELMLNRLAHLYGRGAKKYSDNNWRRGIPLSRLYASLYRHMIQWFAGDTSEDHLAAVIWNATAIMWTEREITANRLPLDLADAGPLKNYEGE